MIYAFDIDGVLTDTGYNIDPKFRDWFIDWSTDKQYVLVTGSTYERTLEQIGKTITDGATIVANCMGNSVYQEGNTVTLNEFELTEEELKFFNATVNSSAYQTRTSNHVVERPGSINFSVVGRNATNKQRDNYKAFDEKHSERLAIAKEIKERFPRFDVFIGGDISLDICLKGANKGQVVDYISSLEDFHGKIIFFGDKLGEWGIDTPLADAIGHGGEGKTFHVTAGYKQTQHILSTGIDTDINISAWLYDEPNRP